MIGAGERDEALRDAWRRRRCGSHCRCRRYRRSANGISAAPCAAAMRAVNFCSATSSRKRGGCGTAARERHLDLAAGVDLREPVLEQAGRHGRDRSAPRSSPPRAPPAPGRRCRQHRRAAEAVTDEDRGRAPALAASASAAATRSATLEENVVLANSPSLEPSPVKSKRSTAMPSAVKPSAMRGGMDVLAAGEAVGKQRVGARLRRRAVEQAGEPQTLGIGEIEPLGRHPRLPGQPPANGVRVTRSIVAVAWRPPSSVLNPLPPPSDQSKPGERPSR